jgi:hypothetical protein
MRRFIFGLIGCLLTVTALAQSPQDYWVKVGFDGADLGRSPGVLSIAVLARGQYRIAFDRDIRQCVSVATITYFSSPGNSYSREPYIQGASATLQPEDSDLLVYTTGRNDKLESHGFVIMTHCPSSP